MDNYPRLDQLLKSATTSSNTINCNEISFLQETVTAQLP